MALEPCRAWQWRRRPRWAVEVERAQDGVGGVRAVPAPAAGGAGHPTVARHVAAGKARDRGAHVLVRALGADGAEGLVGVAVARAVEGRQALGRGGRRRRAVEAAGAVERGAGGLWAVGACGAGQRAGADRTVGARPAGHLQRRARHGGIAAVGHGRGGGDRDLGRLSGDVGAGDGRQGGSLQVAGGSVDADEAAADGGVGGADEAGRERGDADCGAAGGSGCAQAGVWALEGGGAGDGGGGVGGTVGALGALDGLRRSRRAVGAAGAAERSAEL